MGRNRQAPVLAPAVRRTSFTAAHSSDIWGVDATIGSPVVATLDPYAKVSDQFVIADVGGNAGSQPITIQGDNIAGHGSSISINTDGGSVELTRAFDADKQPLWIATGAVAATSELPQAAGELLATSAAAGGGLVVLAQATITPVSTGNLFVAASIDANAFVSLNVGTAGSYGIAYRVHGSGGFSNVVSASFGSVADLTAWLNGLTPGVTYDIAFTVALSGGGFSTRTGTNTGGIYVQEKSVS